MGAIFLGMVLPGGAWGGGTPPYDGRPGREDEGRRYEYVRSPDEYAKKSMQYARKPGAIPKKLKQNYMSHPPIKGMGCEIYRFPKRK